MASIRDRSFVRWLAVIAGSALAFRVAAAFWYDDHTGVGFDGAWYLEIARFVARGIGFREPTFYLILHRKVATAAHPPLYPLFLSVVDFLGLHTVLAHRLWSCVPGTLTVVFVGITARDLAGRRAGLIAAGCAAISISLVAQDVILWSGGFFGMTITLVVLLSYRYLKRPRPIGALLVTAAISVSVLTRAESALLYLILIVPLVAVTVKSVRARARVLFASALTAAIILAPWTIYNAGRFDHPVVLSTGLGGLLAHSNCPAAYDGPLIGSWVGGCAKGLPRQLPSDESTADLLLRKAAFQYAGDHLDRLPVVVPVRLLRTFGVWNARYQFRHDLYLDAANLRWVSNIAVAQYWVYIALGAVGFVALRRRRQSLLPIIAPVITVVAITITGHGALRFRIGFDAVLPILVGVGVVTLLDRRRSGHPAGVPGLLTRRANPTSEAPGRRALMQIAEIRRRSS